MPVLDTQTTATLKQYLGNLRRPIELVASLGEGAKSDEVKSLVEEIAALSDKVTARTDGTDERRPSFAIHAVDDASAEVTFAGLPMGHEFTSLILALLHVGGHPPKEEAELLESVRSLEGEYRFETIKPGPVAGRHGHKPMAPHVSFWLAARGINIGLATRMYFSDEAQANATDPVLNIIEQPARRETLIARREERPGEVVYVFDIYLQGERETVFFDI